jgi:channel protein (hemolysin III family)
MDSLMGFADPIASWLHWAGVAAAVYFCRALTRSGPSASSCAALWVFAFSVMLLLGMSASYHMLAHDTPARAVMNRLDHAAIWVLIAGTYTPIHVILMRGFMRWGMLSIIWAIALSGVVLKTVYFADVPASLTAGLYLFLGWLGVFSIGQYARRHGWRRIMPAFWGGLIYSAGAFLWLFEPPALVDGYFGHHEIFHLAVLGGIAVHWRFIGTEVAAEGRRRRDRVSLIGAPVLAVLGPFDGEFCGWEIGPEPPAN